MRIIDAHSHINVILEEFYSDFFNYTASTGIVSIFINSQTPDEASFLSFFKKSIPGFQNSTDILFFSAIHPWKTKSAETEIKTNLKLLENNLINNSDIYIGETGLDRFRGSDIATQKKVFKSHIDLAVKYMRPFSIHCVREWGNCINILDSYFTNSKNIKIPFIIHAFTGSFETLEILIKLGGYISFPAVMINSGNKKVLENIRKIELSRMLIETDFPYSALDKNGKMIKFDSGLAAGKYYSEMLISAYKTAAELKNISLEKLCGVIEENGKIFTDYSAYR